jgi:hypothetical protein
MRAAQLGEDRYGVVRVVGADAQVAAAQRLGAREQRARLVLELEEPRRDVVEVAAERGQLERPPAALEQAHGIGGLERGDVARQRRLAHLCYRGGAGEAALARDEVEGAELHRVHLS